MKLKVLAIETSCDDTSVAVVTESGEVLALKSLAQDEFHARFGGIVPEVAGRNHSLKLMSVIDELLLDSKISLQDVQGIVVTNRPGLVGSLIVGLVTAKTLSQVLGIPFLGVNHLEGHILAPFLRDASYQPAFQMDQPFVALAVSGGHTSLYLVEAFAKYRVLGQTLDDAAGEAFDKFAKVLGLGFPGGPQVDRLAQSGNPAAYAFPRSMINEETFDMSFSGLKSSATRMLSSLSDAEKQSAAADLCASYQEAIVDILLHRLNKATSELGVRRCVLTGGVSANTRLRQRVQEWASQNRIQILIPPLKYCTDNAAMIGFAGALRLSLGEKHDLSLAPSPQSWPTDFQ